MVKTNMAKSKLRIGSIDGDKLWMETFSSLTDLRDEVLLRAKLDYLRLGPRFHKVFAGSAERLNLEQIYAWFDGKDGYNAALKFGDYSKWILISRETE